MAGLGALLGGYGSDDEGSEQQDGADESPAGLPLLGDVLSAPSGSRSPAAQQQQQRKQQPAAAGASEASPPSAAAAAGGDSDTDTSRRAPLRVMDGPSTNPEPPLEGLSPPPLNHEPVGANGLDELGLEGSEAAAAAAAAGMSAEAWFALPAELREPPPGQPHPKVQQQVELLHAKQQQSGKSVMDYMRNNRRWNNPDFLEKMVDFWRLDQYGTALDPEVWDPKVIPEEDTWQSLAQQLQARKRARGADVRFQSAGQQQVATQPTTAGLAAGVAAAAAAAAGLASQQPGGGSMGAKAAAAAPKMLPPDPRKVEQAQAHAQALANALLSGAKKSKWDK